MGIPLLQHRNATILSRYPSLEGLKSNRWDRPNMRGTVFSQIRLNPLVLLAFRHEQMISA